MGKATNGRDKRKWTGHDRYSTQKKKEERKEEKEKPSSPIRHHFRETRYLARLAKFNFHLKLTLKWQTRDNFHIIRDTWGEMDVSCDQKISQHSFIHENKWEISRHTTVCRSSLPPHSKHILVATDTVAISIWGRP